MPKSMFKAKLFTLGTKIEIQKWIYEKKCFKGHNCLHWAQICEFTVINIVHCLKIQFEQVVNLCPTVI